VGVDLGPEVSHPGREREGRQTLVIAQAGADDVRRQILQQECVGGSGDARRDPVADLADPPETDPARDRLAAGLVGAEAGQEASQVHDARPLVGRDQRARTHVGAGRAEGVELVGRVEELGRQDPTRRTAHEDRLELVDRPAAEPNDVP
jgi:hypothetical protein